MRRQRAQANWIATRLQRFFGVTETGKVQARQRSFPSHVAPDVKRGLDAWFAQAGEAPSAIGVPLTNTLFETIGISSLLAPRSDAWHPCSAVEYQSFDVGDDQTIDCPRHALWLLERNGVKAAIFWTSAMTHTGDGFATRVRLEVGYLVESDGAAIAESLFADVERAVRAASTYRGKVLSLDARDDYGGNEGGIAVHRLRTVKREDVVLADATVALLERNLVRFVQQREALRKACCSTVRPEREKRTPFTI
jgi:hypothetical protein